MNNHNINIHNKIVNTVELQLSELIINVKGGPDKQIFG